MASVHVARFAAIAPHLLFISAARQIPHPNWRPTEPEGTLAALKQHRQTVFVPAWHTCLQANTKLLPRF